MKKLLFFAFALLYLNSGMGQKYKDSSLSTSKRVQDLLSQMSPEEKFWQLFMIPGDLGEDKTQFSQGLFGFQVHTVGQQAGVNEQMFHYGSGQSARETAQKINEIQRFFIEETRLGIPIIAFDEALHGLVRNGATAFPQAIGLAATWNTELVHEVAKAIGRECKTRGIRQILSPVLNLASDVRWGRTEETYGEDPFLTAEMGVAFISAFEQKELIATPKHFVANVGDGGRDSYPIHFNERFMRETHFVPFEAAFKRAGARSVMMAYNSFDGYPCTANAYLINQLLKNEWAFDGFVISDAGGTGGANVLHFTASDYADATVKSIEAGLDVIFQTAWEHKALFSPPFLDGSISQQSIDSAVARVLKQKFELGLFENPYINPDDATIWNGHATHRELALQSARESIVLLKNEGQLLPFSNAVQSIAVIGPDATLARLGGYSGPGNNKISILEGIQKRAKNTTKVHYAKGCDHQQIKFVTVPSEVLSHSSDEETLQGIKGEYFDNVTFSGNPAFTRTDPQIQFQWTLFSPDPEKLPYDFYAVRWTGTLHAPQTGTFKIGIDGNDGFRLYLNGELILDQWIKRGRQVFLTDYFFEEGKYYDLRIDYYEPSGNAWFKLVWDIGIDNDQTKQLEEAVQLAASCDIAVVAVGIEEGEFLDRAYLHLPGKQEAMIRQIATTGTPMVVLLVGGSAITMNNWIEQAESVLQLWYPGEAGGQAVAEILFGDFNPAGRLPVTFPIFEGQLPLVYNHKPTGRGDDYMNLSGQAHFPFGYGLSYTQFSYTDVRLEKQELETTESTRVSVKVTNTGKYAGDEVVQLYIRDELASVVRPIKELKGFQRIHLNPGESQIVDFLITPELLSMIDKDLKKVVEPGTFRLMIGASSKDIRQRILLNVIE